MAKSKALSPEVQGLLEKVRLQAHQYSEAFEYFDNKKEEFDRLLIELEQQHLSFSQFLQQLKLEISKIKDDFDISANANLKIFKDKIAKYDNFNDNYQDLLNFISEIKLFQKDINTKVNHYENNLEHFKSDLGYDVDNSINTLRKTFDDEVEKAVSALKKDLTIRFSIVERMIVEIKSQLLQEEKESENEIKSLKNLLDKSQNESLDYSKTIENNLNREKKKINTIEKDLQNQLYNTNSRMSELLSISKFIMESGNSNEGSSDFDFTVLLSKYFQPKNKIETHFAEIESAFENKVTVLNENLEDLNLRFQKNKNMMIAFLGFGFFFIIALIIIIISSVL